MTASQGCLRSVPVNGSLRDLRILVMPGGTEIALEIHRSLSHTKNLTLFSAGMDVPNHADCVFARHFIMPGVGEPNWLTRLNEIVEERRIDYIFPAHDDALIQLAQCSPDIRASVVTSPLRTCQITRYKSDTYLHLNGVVPVPLTYSGADDIREFPVFVKPDRGQGSQDVHLVRDRDDLMRLMRDSDKYIVLEYLPGEEYTVDCFSDRERGLLFCGGRERIRVRNGIAVQTRCSHAPEFELYAHAISRYLDFHGAWFFQLKRDLRGVLKLLEVASRIAGASAIHRVQGVNLALMSLYEQERMPLEIFRQNIDVELDRALGNRYRHNLKFSTAYVDLDDTLILRGKVNTQLVRFLYQCINDGIRIVLLTRHSGSVSQTLRRHRLGELFDDVVRVHSKESKAAHISEPDALLIDDSFRERVAVARVRRIPVFDTTMIELLLNERE